MRTAVVTVVVVPVALGDALRHRMGMSTPRPNRTEPGVAAVAPAAVTVAAAAVAASVWQLMRGVWYHAYHVLPIRE